MRRQEKFGIVHFVLMALTLTFLAALAALAARDRGAVSPRGKDGERSEEHERQRREDKMYLAELFLPPHGCAPLFSLL